MYILLFLILFFCSACGSDMSSTPSQMPLMCINVGCQSDSILGLSDSNYLIGENLFAYTTSLNGVYQTGRNHLLGHMIPISNGWYNINLHLVKSPQTGTNNRIIECRVNNDLPISINTASLSLLSPVSISTYTFVNNNMLSIRWTSNSSNPDDSPFLSAIEIFPSPSRTPVSPYHQLNVDCTDSFNWFNSSCINSDNPINCIIQASYANHWENTCVPPGTYFLNSTVHIDNSINLYGYDVTLIFTSFITAISLLGSPPDSIINLYGFTIDYDPLPFTQGDVISIINEGSSVNDKREISVKLHQGYPDPSIFPQNSSTFFVFENNSFSRLSNGWGSFSNGFTVHDNILTLLQVHPSDLSMFLDDSGNLKNNLSLVFELHSDGLATIDSLFTQGVLNISHLTVWSSIGASIRHRVSKMSPSYKWITIAPGPPPCTNCPPRLLSSNRDSFHSAITRKGPSIIGAYSTFAGDDGINMSGAPYIISNISCHSATISTTRPWPSLNFIFAPGDYIRILHPTSKHILQSSRVLDVSLVSFSDSQQIYTILCLDPLNYLSLPPIAYADFPAHNSPNGIVMFSVFGPNRANGFRSNGNNAFIYNNLFFSNTSNNILLEPDYLFWKQAGWSDSTSILFNQLLGAYSAAVFINDEVNSSSYMLNNPAHSNLAIYHNYIANPSLCGIYAHALDNLNSIYNNTFVNASPDILWVD